MGVVAILAAVAGLLSLVALIPTWRESYYYPVSVAVLLLAIAVFLVGGGH
jgi:hypothetical protein